MHKATFVLATGRSGTQWLARTIRHVYPDLIVAMHEPLFFDYNPRQLLATGDPAHIDTADKVLAHIEAIERTLDQRPYLETGWFAYACMRYLAKRLDGRFQVIHLTRHPVRAASSLFTHRCYADQPLVEGLNEKALLTPFDAGVRFPDYRSRWADLDGFQKCLYFWLELHGLALELEDELQVPWLRVKFEDLFNRTGLEPVLDFLGLPHRPAVFAAQDVRVDRYSLAADAAWDPETVRSHPRVIDMARRLGYEATRFRPDEIRDAYGDRRVSRAESMKLRAIPPAHGRGAGPGAEPPRTVRSGIDGIGWPALPAPNEARLLAVVHQLAESEWWPPAHLLAWQMRQLELLASHAFVTVPFYRDRLALLRSVGRGRLTPEHWSRIPTLTRDQVQSAGTALRSRAVPKDHGQVFELTTSGSMGKPVTVARTAVANLFYAALNLRLHLWHGRDFAGTMAAIQSLAGRRAEAASAGTPASWTTAHHGGPVYFFDVTRPVTEQLDWLAGIDPDYLLTYPSNLQALVGRSRETGTTLGRLKQVSCMGEVLTGGQRRACEKGWGVPVVDTYSAQEVGFIALQCPDHDHYLVQAENLYLEVLDADGAPCPPGSVGRVVITDLHNFAMPLIRYEIGDFAEAGEPCPTGRGPPVLERIMGRARNMLVLPSGDVLWPSFPAELVLAAAPVRQLQLVQRSPEDIDVRLVMDAPLTPDQERRLGEALVARLGHPFRLTFTRVDGIPPGPGGKYEDFRSEIA